MTSFFLLSLLLAPIANAQTPAITLAPTSAPAAQAPMLFQGGVPNKQYDLSPPGKTFEEVDKEGNVTAILNALNWVINKGLKLPKDFHTPNFNHILTMMEGAVNPLTPLMIQKKKKPEQKDIRNYSFGATLCVRNPLTGEIKKSPGSTISETEPDPQEAKLDQVGRELAATGFGAGYTFTPTADGTYDYSRERPIKLARPPECGENAEGTSQQEKIVGTKEEGINFAEIVMEIIRGVLNPKTSVAPDAKIYSRTVSAGMEGNHCTITGCENEEVNLSYLSPNEAAQVKKAGIGRSFTTLQQTIPSRDAKIPNNFGGSTIETNFTHAKDIEDTGTFIACSLLPRISQQNKEMTTECDQIGKLRTIPTPTPAPN